MKVMHSRQHGSAPYTSDANTLLLQPFDGTTSGSSNGAVNYTNGVFGEGVQLNSCIQVGSNTPSSAYRVGFVMPNNYQIQFKPDFGESWGNWNGGLFTPSDVTSTQYLFITNGSGFLRLQQMPCASVTLCCGRPLPSENGSGAEQRLAMCHHDRTS